MHAHIDKTAIIIHGCISIAGGLANALSKNQIRALEIISHMVIAGFTGTIAGMLAMHFFGDTYPYLTLSVSGSFGFAGKEGMDFILRVVKRSIQANIK